jgi:gas vesicle protein
MAKRNQNHVRYEDDAFGPFVLGALVGGVIAAIGAFWFAPQSGAETRQELQERGNELRDDIEQAAADTRRRIEGDSVEESIRMGKAEARRYQETMR